MSARAPGAVASSDEAQLAPQAAADELTRLYRLARTLCGSADLAEDLVQETYARVFARPRLLRGGDTFSYMARALRNTFYNDLRSARARPTQALPDDERAFAARSGSRGDPHAALVAAELYGAIATLPDDQREVIAFVDVAGLSYKEAARVLRIPPGTVMSRLYRARARLADALS
jgi:RNA polymerase sigma-70 factor, ECF subfamily